MSGIRKTSGITRFTHEDIKYMRLALALAEKARGRTSPNPIVGAVVIKNGMILSRGYHRKAGYPHAEIEAINACDDKEQLKGSTLYVTLEPCSVYGRTPPCTDSIIKHGISRVIAGSIDPNPAVNGQGFKKLKAAGLNVEYGLLKEAVEIQNEVFFKAARSGVPFVTVKIASSIDGRTAIRTGDSKWITSEKSRGFLQKIRYFNDCILTGINTVLRDDPLLYPRITPHSGDILNTDKKFFRAILDSSLRIDPDSRIVNSADRIKTLVFTSALDNNALKKAAELEKKGLDIVEIGMSHNRTEPGARGFLDLSEALKALHDRYEVTSIFVEAGHTLCSELLKNNHIDKFLFFIAPKIIGDDSSFGMFADLNTLNLEDCPGLVFESIKKIGRDFLITAYPQKKGV